MDAGMPKPQPMGEEASQTQSQTQPTRDVKGKNFRIPKGDFAHFLGWEETKASRAPKSNAGPSGADTLTAAMQKLQQQVRDKFQKLGKGAVERADKLDNVGKAAGDVVFNKGEGSAAQKTQDALAVTRETLEMGHKAGLRYLELQYKFKMASRNTSVISNIMKRRNEAVKKSYNQIR